MRMAGVKHSLKWFWIVGVVVWFAVISLLLWHLYEAETLAQSSFYETRLASASIFGVFWGIAPAIWQARLKKTRTNQV
jgi:hypothetical protein